MLYVPAGRIDRSTIPASFVVTVIGKAGCVSPVSPFVSPEAPAVVPSSGASVAVVASAASSLLSEETCVISNSAPFSSVFSPVLASNLYFNKTQALVSTKLNAYSLSLNVLLIMTSAASAREYRESPTVCNRVYVLSYVNSLFPFVTI